VGPGLTDDDDPLRPIALGARALVLTCHGAGVLVMLGAIVWGGWLRREQYGRLRTAADPA